MTEDIQTIPHLLHDAKLVNVEWEPQLDSLRLFFSCLMRNIDGTTISDPIVELRLDGIERLAAYYSPANCEVKPSEFVITEAITKGELSEWKRRPTEAYMTINSAEADFQMATACEVSWLIEASKARETGTGLRVHLIFEDHHYGKDAVATRLFIDCGSLQPLMAGTPLSIDHWRNQFEAWWRGWEEYWSTRNSDAVHGDSSPQEEKFIPAGVDPPPDLSYKPPSKPVFQLLATDAPAELLKPLEDFHVGLMQRDWLRMASSYPNFDLSNDERAEGLENQYLGPDFGRWVYLRQVDWWWAEGHRACVAIRGIEHVMPDEEDPLKNHETVITYGLLKADGKWIISTWSQGRPQYGSTPTTEGQPSWWDDWNLNK